MQKWKQLTFIVMFMHHFELLEGLKLNKNVEAAVPIEKNFKP